MRPSVPLVVTTSLTATYRPPFSDASSVGSPRTRYSPASTRDKSCSSTSGSIEARKPTRPKLTPMTGTPVPSSFASVRRMVPSPPTATVKSAPSGSSTTWTPFAAATPRTRSIAGPTSMRPCPTIAIVSGLDGCGDSLVEVIWEGRVVGLREVDEELPVALRARQTRVYDAERRGPPRERRLRDLADDARTHTVVADDATPAHVAASRLELRLHQHDRAPPGRCKPERGRQRDPDGDERDVAHDQLRCERQLVERARVRALEHDDALVGAQPFVQLAVADVDRNHAGSAALQEHVGETAGGGADVEAVEARRVQAEGVERVRELLAAARDVRRAALELELGAFVHLLARLLVARHEAREHQRLRLRARLGEPPLHKEDVQALLHAGRVELAGRRADPAVRCLIRDDDRAPRSRLQGRRRQCRLVRREEAPDVARRAARQVLELGACRRMAPHLHDPPVSVDRDRISRMV